MKPINNRHSFSNTTITTTVSKHDSLQQQLQPQQQRSLIKSPNSNSSNLINTNFNANNSRLDSSTIQIDSINNNNASAVANAAAPAAAPVEKDQREEEAKDQSQSRSKKKSIKRNTSLMNFKPFDFHLKSIYSGLRRKSQSEIPRSNATSTTGGSTSTRKLPYLRVETVDTDESQNPLLVTYPQSPYQQRGSFDKSTSQLLNISHYDMSRSQASSPFLSPGSGNIRRSSTSDIVCKKSSGTSSTDSRRPSTSDLLRRARERKDSDGGRLGRSISQGGLPRGGCRGGRRTSMAF